MGYYSSAVYNTDMFQDKPVVIPDRADEKLPRVFNPPEFIRNVWGEYSCSNNDELKRYTVKISSSMESPRCFPIQFRVHFKIFLQNSCSVEPKYLKEFWDQHVC